MKFQAPNFHFPKHLYGVALSIHRESRRALGCYDEVRDQVEYKKSPLTRPSEALCKAWEGAARTSRCTGGQGMLLNILILCAILFSPLLLSAQNFTQTIERTARFGDAANPANELSIYNIHGSVTVEGYEGEEIRITARQKIEGTTQEITQAREELKFIVDQEDEQVLIYIDAPFITLRKDRGRIGYNMHRWDDDYDFLYDITVQLPKQSKIHASTVNNGNVIIRNTTRNVEASNVNGSVTLQGITGPTDAHTVNGDITIRYARNPVDDSDYETINGTIEVSYMEDLSADIRFKSLHGELYTDFENTKRLQARIKTERRKNDSSTRYKVDQFAPIRIGDGGPTFSFEVLNGDVYIKRIQS